jgi:predicted nucleic acid-binding protein
VVVDESALLEVLLPAPGSVATHRTIGMSKMVVPDLIVVEVLSAVHRLGRQRLVTATRAERAVNDLLEAPVSHLPALSLAAGTWRLCENVGAYDACNVALAVTLDCALVGADVRPARAPGLPARVIVT